MIHPAPPPEAVLAVADFIADRAARRAAGLAHSRALSPADEALVLAVADLVRRRLTRVSSAIRKGKETSR